MSTKQNFVRTCRACQSKHVMPHTTTIDPIILNLNRKAMPFVGKRTDNQLELLSDAQTTPDSCNFYINYNTNEQSIEDQDQIQDFITNTVIYLPIFMSIYVQNNHFTKITLSTLHVGAYPHTADLLALNARGYGQLTPPAIEGLNHIQSPLVSKEWEKALQFHPDRAFVHYLLMGIQQGFRIGFDFTCRLSSSPKNMCSANDHPSVVADCLANELHAGRILGPIPSHLRDSIHISSFGVIPKRHQENKWRLILDLSHPLQASVNAGIPKDLCSLQYASIDDAANIVSELGQGTKLAKVDIAHAYRNILVYPTDRLVLGLQWENNIFIDKVLPFGLRSAPKIFCAISDALEWILHTKGVSACLHYIDDFLTFGYPGSNQCDINLHILIQTCQELGLPLAVLKVEGPAAIIIFLGIELNTVLMTMRLPDEKLARLKELIHKWLTCHAAKKRELLSLIGQLVHACKVVIPGRIFLRRMLDLAASRHDLDHWIRLNEGFRSDLVWWDMFMDSWNGVSLLKSHIQHPPDVHIFTDASGSWGCGGTRDGFNPHGPPNGQI